MHGSLIITVVLAAMVVAFIVTRQVVERPVTQRGLLLPPVLGAGLGALFLAGYPGPGGIAAAVAGLAIGGGTGLLGGRVVRVWRDAATGVVLERGGWRYLVVVLALLLTRVLLRLAFARGGVVDAATLNVALIAALVGNLLARDARIALRALPLAGGSFSGLSNR